MIEEIWQVSHSNLLYDANKGFQTVIFRIFEYFCEVHDIYPKLENIPVQNILFPIAEQARIAKNILSWCCGKTLGA